MKENYITRGRGESNSSGGESYTRLEQQAAAAPAGAAVLNGARWSAWTVAGEQQQQQQQDSLSHGTNPNPLHCVSLSTVGEDNPLTGRVTFVCSVFSLLLRVLALYGPHGAASLSVELCVCAWGMFTVVS